MKLVRSKTPKVTIYTSKAKCMLMENSPNHDFETVFYDGRYWVHLLYIFSKICIFVVKLSLIICLTRGNNSFSHTGYSRECILPLTLNLIHFYLPKNNQNKPWKEHTFFLPVLPCVFVQMNLNSLKILLMMKRELISVHFITKAIFLEMTKLITVMSVSLGVSLTCSFLLPPFFSTHIICVASLNTFLLWI